MSFIINFIGLVILNTFLRSVGCGLLEMLIVDFIVLVVINSLAYEPPTKEDKNDIDS